MDQKGGVEREGAARNSKAKQLKSNQRYLSKGRNWRQARTVRIHTAPLYMCSVGIHSSPTQTSFSEKMGQPSYYLLLTPTTDQSPLPPHVAKEARCPRE